MPKETAEKIKKTLYNEVTFVIAICSIVVGVCLFITRADNRMTTDIEVIKTQVSNIEDNHLTHIQGDISDIKSDIKEIRSVIIKSK